MKKILIVGSGTYTPEWWDRHGANFIASGYEVWCLNAAAAVVIPAPRLWLRSSDYNVVNPIRATPGFGSPTELVAGGNFGSSAPVKFPDHVSQAKLTNELPCGTVQTMFPCALAHALNDILRTGGGGTVAVTGCDMVYESDRNNFYGGKTRDLESYGIARAADEVDFAVSQAPGVRVVNVGDQPYSNLRIERADPRTEATSSATFGIVRKIHQTWKTTDIPDNDFPHVWQQSWKEKHPDFEYCLWTDADNDDFIRTYYGEWHEAYNRLTKGVVKSDAARALILHKYGGLYADLDYIALRSMRDVLETLSKAHGRHMLLMADQHLFSPPWDKIHTNALMYAPPGNSVLLRVVEDGFRDINVNARAYEHSDPENVFGPARFGWINQRMNGEAIGGIPAAFSAPRGAMHESFDEAAFNRWRDTDAVRRMFPTAFAVTPRRGCWWRSPWEARGTRGSIQGC